MVDNTNISPRISIDYSTMDGPLTPRNVCLLKPWLKVGVTENIYFVTVLVYCTYVTY